MLKKSAFLLSMILFSINLFCINDDTVDTVKVGTVYEDAIYIASHYKDPAYFNKINKMLCDNTLYGVSEESNNPYLLNNEEIKAIIESGNSYGKRNQTKWNVFQESFLNTDVSYFASGLSRFLAERTKEELNEAFFSKMKDEITRYPELTTVFPQTTIVLNHIENYLFSSVMHPLKDAFEADMQNLPQNFYNLKYCYCMTNDAKCYAKIDTLRKFFETPNGKWLQLGLTTVNEAKLALNPADFLNSLVKTSDFKALKAALKDGSALNVPSFIELNNLISQSLLSRDPNQVWITLQQLNTLLQPEVFQIYLGLLLAKSQKEKIVFYKNNEETISFDSILINNYGTYEQFYTLVQSAYLVYNLGNQSVQKLIENQSDTIIAPQALYETYHTAFNSIRPIAYSIAGDSINLSDFDRIESIFNPAVDLVYHTAVRRYSSAIFNATVLLDELSKYNEKEFKPVAISLMKYGTLIANVASAKNSDQVKDAIAASAMPVGSSVIKRNAKFSIMLNAYVGFYSGATYHCQPKDSLIYEEIKEDTTITSLHNKAAFAYGIYAPIGVSFNWGTRHKGAISANVQLFDVGSLVNFYLQKGDFAEYPYKVNMINVLSPGLQLGYVFKNTPLQLYAGANYIPALQAKTSENKSFYGGWRFQVGLAVDIPMYKLYII
jgi:hypothetical protein